MRARGMKVEEAFQRLGCLMIEIPYTGVGSERMHLTRVLSLEPWVNLVRVRGLS